MTSTLIERPARNRGVPHTVPTCLRLDPGSSVPRYRQIYEAVRTAIVCGHLAPGTRLPASRALADDLGVSRITVLGAYDELEADGLISGRAGAGTVVLRRVGEPNRSTPSIAPNTLRAYKPVRSAENGPRTFALGLGALDLFPTVVWGRLAARRWRDASVSALHVDRGAGHRQLRQEIATHLLLTRGVPCTADHIVVTTGVRHAVELAVRVLVGDDGKVVLEDPAERSHRAAVASLGERVVNVPVDGQGLDVCTARCAISEARLFLVTPRGQSVLGVRMSASRRRALLDQAAATGAWIVEIDDGAELRAERLKELSLSAERHAAARRVIHVGSFATTLLPSLCIGYAVVPPELTEAFVAARNATDCGPSTIEQAVLADFMREGHFARHVRRTRAALAQRRHAFAQLANDELRGFIRIDPAPTVCHVVAWLPSDTCDAAVALAGARRDVEVVALSSVRVHPTANDGPALLLGYAAFGPEQTRRALVRLADALRECAGRGAARFGT